MDVRDETASDPAFLCTGMTAARASLKLQKDEVQTRHGTYASFQAANSPDCRRWFYFFRVFYFFRLYFVFKEKSERA